MKVIVILADSLRKDHLGCYGNEWIETPNIDALAKESVIFENAYPEALPTIPVRTALFTGQYTLPYRPWQPLTKEDITAAEILRRYGYLTALITDTYHLAKPGMNFHRGFHVFRWIRGQEADAYKSGPSSKNINDFIKSAMKGDIIERVLRQYLKNIEGREKEEDYFVAQVVQETIAWLEANYKHDDFFLWVDCFDPHEPWDPPSPFDKKYTDPGYKGKKLIHPKYGKVDWMTKEELKYVRGLYAGEVSFVDKWIGHLFNKIKELKIYDESLIIFLSDHGHPHGDHGSIMKTPDNLYSELLRIPLLIKYPGGLYAGKRIDELILTSDILPTILEIINLPKEAEGMQGRSIQPVVEGKKDKIREYIITGYHDSVHRCIRDKEWSFILRPKGQKDELYNLKEDSQEKNNLIDDYPEKAKEMASKIAVYFRNPGSKEPRALQQKYEISHTPVE